MTEPEDWAAEIRAAILDGDEGEAERLAELAVARGADPLTAIEGTCIPAIRAVGDAFEDGDLFLPELVTSAGAMQAAMSVFRPLLTGADGAGTVVLGTAKGDVHDIGKTLVGTLLAAHGFTVHDMGVDVSPERFVDRARETDADLVGISALLTTTMAGQRDVVAAIRAAGLRAAVLVGGAPVRAGWAEQIGADGWAETAAGAVLEARRLTGAR